MLKVVIGFSIVLSFICILLAAVPFTSAISISFILLLFAGIIGYKGYLQSSLILLLLNTLAVIGSPGMDISKTNSLVFILLIFLISFGSIFIGIRKLILKCTAQSKPHV